MFDHVRCFITKCGYYLQDPVGCGLNVPYLNPQCLGSLHESPILTFDLAEVPHKSVDDVTRTPVDILAGFETTDSFEEAPTPTALRTTLKPYVGGELLRV